MPAAPALGTGSLLFAASALAYFLVLDRAFCRYEETKLAAAFGADYEAYRRQARRWL